jgi:hypothetical protein
MLEADNLQSKLAKVFGSPVLMFGRFSPLLKGVDQMREGGWLKEETFSGWD